MLQKLNSIGQTSTDNGRVIVVDKYGNVKKLPQGGGFSFTIVNIATNYTVSFTSGNYIILCDTTAGPITVTMPTTVGNTAEITVKKIAGPNPVTVAAAVGETIDYQPTIGIKNVTTSISMVPDGTNWNII